MILKLLVAEKLGMTLAALNEQMSMDELILWSVFYELRNDEERSAMDKAKRQRR